MFAASAPQHLHLSVSASDKVCVCNAENVKDPEAVAAFSIFYTNFRIVNMSAKFPQTLEIKTSGAFFERLFDDASFYHINRKRVPASLSNDAICRRIAYFVEQTAPRKSRQLNL